MAAALVEARLVRELRSVGENHTHLIDLFSSLAICTLSTHHILRVVELLDIVQVLITLHVNGEISFCSR